MNRCINVPRRAHASGFTLIEMLVALTLLAMIALLSWRGLDATIRGRDDLIANLAQTRVLGRYFSQLQFDMLNLVTPAQVDGPPLRILPGELVLVRHLGVGGAAAARVQVVRYRLKGRQLIRSASQPLATLSQLNDALHHMDDFASVPSSESRASVIRSTDDSSSVACWRASASFAARAGAPLPLSPSSSLVRLNWSEQ